MDFSQIKKAVIETIELDQVNNYIYFLNKFNNLEELDFCSIDSETLFKMNPYLVLDGKILSA